MKLFIWHSVSYVSSNYHHEGAVVVIADSLDRAREMIAEKTAKCADGCGAMVVDPDLTRECEGPELIAVHIDAGCC